MKSVIAFALLLPAIAAAVSLSISPDPIYDCTSGYGRATITWSGAPGPVEVRVGASTGPSMTGLTDPSGSTETADWVGDGLGFFLVNEQGVVLANVSARVRCGGSTSSSGSYFPLETGNTWVYRSNSRAATSTYVTRVITRSEQIGLLTYYVLADDPGASVMRVRADSAGRIWQFTGTVTNPAEVLLLDPATTAVKPFTGPLGSFPESVSRTVRATLVTEDQVYVRGVGLARTSSTMLSGSSGGFLASLDLVEARLGGGVRLSLPSAHFSLAVENAVLDVTGGKVTNCAIPSYCVACSLIGADPPGTYKPCAQARIDVQAEAPYTLELELMNDAGQVVYRAPDAAVTAGDLIRYVQLQLYVKPNQPLPPGNYSLAGRIKRGIDVLAAASLALRIE